MRFAVRSAMLCAGLSAAGCGLSHKPYANDPLLRDGRAVWATRDTPPANPAPPPPAIEPQQPPAVPITSRRD